MWVGRSATPNTLAEAGRRIKQLRDARQAPRHREPGATPRLPLVRNPPSTPRTTRSTPMPIGCVSAAPADCDFADGLPVHLIDEAVYAARPTLVIATVDKFASMPWRPATAALFNRDDDDGRTAGVDRPGRTALDLRPVGYPHRPVRDRGGRTRRPAQGDRLHSHHPSRRPAGPSSVRPRRRQFPPAGLDARDSWFAVETPSEEKASRRYVGLLTSSTSQSTLLIRTYATLLHQAAGGDARTRCGTPTGGSSATSTACDCCPPVNSRCMTTCWNDWSYLANRDGVSTR